MSEAGGRGRRPRTPAPAAAADPRPRGGRGRRPGGEDTRARILEAARQAFAERGYDGATVRDVAGRAGVDPALVHHYFGTKQRLFVAAMEFPVDVGAIVPVLLADGHAGVGERFVRFVVELWDRPDVRPTLAGVVRSAATDEVAASMMRGVLTDGPLRALAIAIDRPDSDVRVALAGTQLVGLVMARYVLRIEPLVSMTPAAIATFVGPAVERYLFGELGRGGGDGPPRRLEDAAAGVPGG